MIDKSGKKNRSHAQDKSRHPDLMSETDKENSIVNNIQTYQSSVPTNTKDYDPKMQNSLDKLPNFLKKSQMNSSLPSHLDQSIS